MKFSCKKNLKVSSTRQLNENINNKKLEEWEKKSLIVTYVRENKTMDMIWIFLFSQNMKVKYNCNQCECQGIIMKYLQKHENI